ncbi:putative Mg2+ transporter-C (MgtC) family protein [Arthrobacter pigmenti]|uniref:Putative Mg2+ transporter-C (MgtC) family protein n=1 Tax=Arthrobacter pigmenti TaxID=271432 RepID=A0A846RMI6_9MICC|nr:MgtC/SapB family protein [Arthrobacter pigmenti]NJC24463.1 putative Mg2+ transporter-C (MgtC) family protein [Arthrobacter pigmenti]
MLDILLFSATTPTQLVLLLLAFLLSAVIGVERLRKLKSAGLRTHTLVGVGSAVFTLVSAYGFETVVGNGVVLDPSRIAAQVVSGIGFLGAGLIFVRRNTVTGLTTAASVWVTAAIGMACGAGMPMLAIAATALHLVTVSALTMIGTRIRPHSKDSLVRIRYRLSCGGLRAILTTATELGYDVSLIDSKEIRRGKKQPQVEVILRLSGDGAELDDLLARLTDLAAVTRVANSTQSD